MCSKSLASEMLRAKTGQSRSRQKIQPNGSPGWGLHNCSRGARGVSTQGLPRPPVKPHQGGFASVTWATGSLGTARWEKPGSNIQNTFKRRLGTHVRFQLLSLRKTAGWGRPKQCVASPQLGQTVQLREETMPKCPLSVFSSRSPSVCYSIANFTFACY